MDIGQSLNSERTLVAYNVQKIGHDRLESLPQIVC